MSRETWSLLRKLLHSAFIRGDISIVDYNKALDELDDVSGFYIGMKQ